MLYGFHLLPRYFQNFTDDIAGSIVDEYQNDIPYPDDLPQEIHRWTTLTSNKEIGSKCTIELAITHTQFYPNIRQIQWWIQGGGRGRRIISQAYILTYVFQGYLTSRYGF